MDKIAPFNTGYEYEDRSLYALDIYEYEWKFKNGWGVRYKYVTGDDHGGVTVLETDMFGTYVPSYVGTMFADPQRDIQRESIPVYTQESLNSIIKTVADWGGADG